MRRFLLSFSAFIFVSTLTVVVPSGPPAAAAEPSGFDPTTLQLEPQFAEWGVVGRGDSSHADEDHGGIRDWTGPQPEVWDFAEHGDLVFVGGVFTGVRRNEFWYPEDPIHEQPFVAAFERDSGDWISTWRPQLNGVVYDLSITNDGVLLVGGEFTEVNGVARSGLVGLDPSSGAIVDTFQASVSRLDPAEIAWVKEIVVDGDDVFIGGQFSQVSDANGTASVRAAAKLDARTGERDPSWNIRPTGGSVWDLTIDHDRGLVHLVGYFTALDALPDTARFGTVRLADGSAVPSLPALPTNHAWNNDTVTITRANDQTWVGGGNHLLNVLDPATNDPRHTAYFGDTGDIQVIERIGDVVALGHHGNYGGGLVFHDAETFERIPVSVGLSRRTYGVWAIAQTADGCLWVGGDANRTRRGEWLGGIARFCEGDNPGNDFDNDGLTDTADSALRPLPDAEPLSVDTWPLVAATAAASGNDLQWLGNDRAWQAFANSDRFSSYGLAPGSAFRLSFQVGESPSSEAVMIGLGAVEEGESHTDIDRALYLRSGNLYVYEAGRNQGAIESFVQGDELSIEVVGATLRYQRNGRTFLTSTVPRDVDWYVDTAAWGEAPQSMLGVTLVALDEDRDDPDGDGYSNAEDLDSDGDGIADVVEIGLADADGDFQVDDPSQRESIDVAPDTDGDGDPDHLDLDSDNDGIFDIAASPAAVFDSNGDGRINREDVFGGRDTDRDGVDDLVEAPADGDGDGIPDRDDSSTTEGPSRSQTGAARQDGDWVQDGVALAAQNAVDGQRDGLNWAANGDLAVTAQSQEPWWDLDLGQSYEIDGINVWRRLDCCADQLDGAVVMIGSVPFDDGSVADAQADAVWATTIDTASAVEQIRVPGIVGRYVRIQRAVTDVVSLVEVDVFGTETDLPPFGTPAGVEVERNGLDQVTIGWSPVANAKGYLVHRDYTFVAWLPPGTTAYLDDDVVEGREYRYQVRAQARDNSYSEPTAAEIVRIAAPEDLPPFGTPGGVSVVSNGVDDVTLGWDRVAGTKGYVIHRDFRFVKWVAADVGEWVDTDVVVGETYRYQVRAQAPDNSYSVPSPLQSVTVFDDDGLAPFGTPANPVIATNGLDAVSLSWEPVAGAKGYVVHRDYQFVKWVPFTESSWSDDTVEFGETYRYQIRAQAPDNSYSAPTAIEEVLVGEVEEDSEAPSTPDGVVAQRSADGSSITLVWDAASDNVGVTSYLIHDNWSYVAWVGADTTTFTHSGLDPDSVHRYQVRARDAADNVSPPSTLTRVAPN
ncbi:MAG: discoidin domain-containing protein [Actinomycetota bacterium]